MFLVCFFIPAVLTKSVRPTNAVCIAAEFLSRVMKDKGYALYRGKIHKRPPEAVYTFLPCCTVEKFLNIVVKNAHIANVIIPVFCTLSNLLSNPHCQLIPQLVIDYNYVEVLPRGRCFNIQRKCFQFNPVELNGSPRNFIFYEQAEEDIPYPRYFVEGR